MSTFIDTSALLAVLDADDLNHPAAKGAWVSLLADGDELHCTNYVLVETYALLQNRLGMQAVRTFHEDIAPVLRVDWADAASHASSAAALLTAGRRTLSLVDCASFEAMRRLGITVAFTFDRHFGEQGFRCMP